VHGLPILPALPAGDPHPQVHARLQREDLRGAQGHPGHAQGPLWRTCGLGRAVRAVRRVRGEVHAAPAYHVAPGVRRYLGEGLGSRVFGVISVGRWPSVSRWWLRRRALGRNAALPRPGVLESLGVSEHLGHVRAVLARRSSAAGNQERTAPSQLNRPAV